MPDYGDIYKVALIATISGPYSHSVSISPTSHQLKFPNFRKLKSEQVTQDQIPNSTISLAVHCGLSTGNPCVQFQSVQNLASLVSFPPAM